VVYFWLACGAVVGSFLNVCIHRLPHGESLAFPPSHCPACGHRLAPFDLVPVLSYLWLRGKCRYCRAPISRRYPLVEGLTAAGFALAYSLTGPNYPQLSYQLVFLAVMIVVFFIDLETQFIPDSAVVIAAAAGLLYHLWLGFPWPFLSSLLGLGGGYLLLFSIGWVGKLLYRKEVLGEGDPLLAAALGAGLGWVSGLLAIFLGYLMAAVVLTILLATQRVKMDQYVPFGPALAAGGVVALFFGPAIINWYLGFLL
jgi:leader peptidase (prepilin peptidase)/N-methyltransferase